jgi:RimJ/RimL family protein N-acetyltransferase
MILDKATIIHTDRLVLRPLRTDDATELFALFSNWNVIRLLSSPPWPYTPHDAEQYIHGTASGAVGEESLAITAAPHAKRLIGLVSVRDRQPSHLQAGQGPNIGYWIGEPYWGQGFMSETVRSFVQHIFKSTGRDAIYSGAFSENAASLRVQEKCGFVVAGTTTLSSNPRGGEFPHINTVLTREQFELISS